MLILFISILITIHNILLVKKKKKEKEVNNTAHCYCCYCCCVIFFFLFFFSCPSCFGGKRYNVALNQTGFRQYKSAAACARALCRCRPSWRRLRWKKCWNWNFSWKKAPKDTRYCFCSRFCSLQTAELNVPVTWRSKHFGDFGPALVWSLCGNPEGKWTLYIFQTNTHTHTQPCKNDWYRVAKRSLRFHRCRSGGLLFQSSVFWWFVLIQVHRPWAPAEWEHGGGGLGC